MIKQYKLLKKQNNFEVILNYKGVKVKVCFNGGNTYKGVNPRCYEKDPFKQKAIEASSMFKSKEIILERTIAEPGDGKPAVAVQTKKVVKMVVAKPLAAGQPASETDGHRTSTGEPLAAEPQGTEPSEEQGAGEQENESMSFANLGEAILYIAQTWQMQVTTEKEARDILKAHGINPRIGRGK